MTKADPKPQKRIVDRYVYTLFHDQGFECVACTNQPRLPVEAHHLVSRGQGGDDVMANLIPLCRSCHGAFHNGNRAPRRMVARYVRSDSGQDAAAYLIHKLTPFGAENYLRRLEGMIS